MQVKSALQFGMLVLTRERYFLSVNVILIYIRTFADILGELVPNLGVLWCAAAATVPHPWPHACAPARLCLSNSLTQKTAVRAVPLRMPCLSRPCGLWLKCCPRAGTP